MAYPAYDPDLWNQVAAELPQISSIVGAVIYADAEDKDDLAAVTFPVLQHLAGGSFHAPERTESLSRYYYSSLSSHKFATPSHEEFKYASEAVSYTRNLGFLKPLMGGPYFDLEAIWDEHTYYEFADRSVEHTMSTMVQEPYVNHVPTVSKPFAPKQQKLIGSQRLRVGSAAEISRSSIVTILYSIIRPIQSLSLSVVQLGSIV